MASLNLASVLEHPARVMPDRIAITFKTQNITYGELNALADRVAAGLQAIGIRAGDHVALSCPNVPWYPMARRICRSAKWPGQRPSRLAAGP